MIRTPGMYHLKDLSLARSMDFRPVGECRGIVLVLATPAPNFRTYNQFMGRVGRHGDACDRVRLCAEIDGMENCKYIDTIEGWVRKPMEELLKPYQDYTLRCKQIVENVGKDSISYGEWPGEDKD